MEVFETQPSTRRSTRARPAAISSTARWRSSIRPWRETAKSTRSSLPPPSITCCELRTRLSWIHASSAATSASAATAAAAIAIAAVAELLTSRANLLQREDHRILGAVVRDRLLVRNGLDQHLHRRRLRAEEARVELDVAEGDRRLRLLVHEGNRLVLDDVLRTVGDRQRDRNVHLGRVAGVLDRDRKAETRARGDRQPLGSRELDPFR